MKYYSEKLDKAFDTEEDCKKAEADYEEGTANEEKAVADKKAEVSKRKKELSDAINECKTQCDIAYNHLAEVRKQAKDTVNTAREEADKHVVEVRKAEQAKVNQAEAEVNEACTKCLAQVETFNKEFGPYRTYTYLTGRDVARLTDRTFRKIHSFIDSVFDFGWLTF